MSGREDRTYLPQSSGVSRGSYVTKGTRRGVPFWEDNRSAGTMASSWRDPNLFPWGNIGWTRGGVSFWKDNRPDGTMTPSWRDPDLFPRVALALTVGQSAAQVALPCHDCVRPLQARGGEGVNTITPQKGEANQTSIVVVGLPPTVRYKILHE